MKEFIYTCEHCGSEYSISEPGKYECSICNNTFIIEDIQKEDKIQFQEQEEKLNKIKNKAKNQNSEKDNKENKTKQKKKPKYKGDLGHFVLYILFLFSAAVTAVSIILLQFKPIAAIVLSVGIPSTILSFIVLEFYSLIQAIEYNTRKEE